MTPRDPDCPPYTITSYAWKEPKGPFSTPDAACYAARERSRTDAWGSFVRVVDRFGKVRGHAHNGRFHWLDEGGKEIIT